MRAAKRMDCRRQSLWIAATFVSLGLTLPAAAQSEFRFDRPFSQAAIENAATVILVQDSTADNNQDENENQEDDQDRESRSSRRSRGRRTRAPSMIGDFFGSTSGGQLTIASFDDFGLPETIDIPSPSAGGAGVGQIKIAENTSPIPRHRVFMNYSYFDNVPLISSGVPVNRFSPGFERTFFNEAASIEMRFPFAVTLNSTILADRGPDHGQVEFGNVSITGKALLYRTETWAVSAGLQVALPTADDAQVSLTDGTQFLEVQNHAVHLKPFLGGLYRTSDRLFAQGFIQLDFDANGNPVAVNSIGEGLAAAGRLNDVTYLFIDVGVGWRMYQSESSTNGLTGITPMFELHYNRSLQSTDVVSVPDEFQIGSFAKNFESLNFVIGSVFSFGSDSTLTLGYTIPLAGGLDKQFDGEVRAFYTRYFGGTQGTVPP